MKKVFVITEKFYPYTGATSQLVTDLAQGFLSQDIDVTIVTTTRSSLQKKLDYKIIAVGSSMLSSTILSKITGGAHFFLKAFIWTLLHLDSDSQLLIFSNPPFIGLLGFLLKLFKRVDYTFVLQDLFPRSAVVSGILPPYGLLRETAVSLMKLVISHSKTTIVLSESMKKRAILEYDNPSKFNVIPNWPVKSNKVDEHFTQSIKESWSLNDHFIVMYSGNFGRLHDFITLLECARITQDLPIKYLFVGTGGKFNQIDTYKNYYQLSNVIIKPPQDRESLNSILALADISVVTLLPGSEDTVSPSKLYGILQNAKPILVISRQTAETALEVVEANCGFHISQGDIQELRTLLATLLNSPETVFQMGQAAYHLYQKRYRFQTSLNAYSRVLSSNY